MKYGDKKKKTWLIGGSRLELFGIAALLVIMVHSDAYNWTGYPGFLLKICTLGSIGVDVFLLLSGMGLYYSMKKCGNVITFYKHRIRRIIPSFLLIAGIQYGFMFVLHKISFGDWLLHTSTLYLWVKGGTIEWYVPYILVCYFIYPVIYKILNSNRGGEKLLCIIIGLFLGGVVFIKRIRLVL